MRLELLRRAVAFLVCASSMGVLGGCSPVSPYQRGALAHPTMTSEDLATGLEAHVRAVSEGASGGLGGGGGGCGCN